jgi:transposase
MSQPCWAVYHDVSSLGFAQCEAEARGSSTEFTKYKQINSVGCTLWAKEESMKPICVPDLAPEQLTELEESYRSTRSVRLGTRAQMVLLAAERGLTAREIAEIVRSSEETVRRWLKRYLAEGVEGLSDAPQPGAPRKVTEEYRERLVQAVRRRPGSLGLPFSLWTLRRLGPTTWPSKPAYGWSTRR